MAGFRNLNDLGKHLSNNVEGRKIVANKLAGILRKEAARLELYMKEELEKYFQSYQPKKYKRTGNTLESFRIEEPEAHEDGTASIKITFDPALAYHPSVMDEETQPEGYTPWLLEVGWDISDKVPGKPMFSEHPGVAYVKKAVERFNADNPYGLVVMVFHGDERYI